jgi:hypothetical protein
VWDDDLQDFVMRDPSHAATLKMRELEVELAALKTEVSKGQRSTATLGAVQADESPGHNNTATVEVEKHDDVNSGVQPSRRKSDMMKAAERMGAEIGRVTAASSDRSNTFDSGPDTGYVDVAPTPSSAGEKRSSVGGLPDKGPSRNGSRASNHSVGQGGGGGGGWRTTPVRGSHVHIFLSPLRKPTSVVHHTPTPTTTKTPLMRCAEESQGPYILTVWFPPFCSMRRAHKREMLPGCA